MKTDWIPEKVVWSQNVISYSVNAVSMNFEDENEGVAYLAMQSNLGGVDC